MLLDCALASPPQSQHYDDAAAEQFQKITAVGLEGVRRALAQFVALDLQRKLRQCKLRHAAPPSALRQSLADTFRTGKHCLAAPRGSPAHRDSDSYSASPTALIIIPVVQ